MSWDGYAGLTRVNFRAWSPTRSCGPRRRAEQSDGPLSAKAESGEESDGRRVVAVALDPAAPGYAKRPLQHHHGAGGEDHDVWVGDADR
jgi:hypothetical protein